MQGGILVFINNKLTQKGERYVPGVNTRDFAKEVTAVPDIKRNIVEQNAQDIIACYDSSYVSYIVNDSIKCINLKEYKTENVKNVDEQKVKYVKWLNNNKLFILEQSSSDENKYEAYEYNPLDNSITIKASLQLRVGEKIQYLETSTLNNEVFVKITYSSSSEVYRLDSNGAFKKLNIATKEIDGIKFVQDGQKLVYDTLKHNKVYVGDNGKTLDIPEKAHQVLLGVDKSSRVFIGICEGDFISKIYYGAINESVDFWTNIKVAGKVTKEQLIVSEEGKIFKLESQLNKLESIVGDKEYTYKGQFIALNKEGIISVYNNEIIFNK